MLFEPLPTDPSLFQHASGKDQILNENNPAYVIERMDGLCMHIVGASFPTKGYVMPEAMFAFNFAKRLIREFPLQSIFNPRKIDDLCRKVVSPYLLKHTLLAPVCKQLLLLPTPLAEVIAHCLQYDNAYRFRLQLLASETSKEALLRNPRKELALLLSNLKKRESQNIYVKFERVFGIARTLLLLPPFRSAFKKLLKSLDFDKIQLDEADYYWVLVEFPKHLNMTPKQRDLLFAQKGWTLPVRAM